MLKAYVRDVVRTTRMLSREEELVTARRYANSRDPADARLLVEGNLRLVMSVAFKFARSGQDPTDLIQEGNRGLVEALRRFDPERGVRFTSYAIWWVRAFILKYVIENARLVKIGTTHAQRHLFFNFTEACEKLGDDPGAELTAASERIRDMRLRMSREVSLDAHAEGRFSLSETIPSSADCPETALAAARSAAAARRLVGAFSETLKSREAEILRRRLAAAEPESLQSIGDRYGVSRERVRQIEARIVRRLKVFARRAGGDVNGN